MKFDFTTDVALKGPVWARVIDTLNGTIFDTYWDIYSLCISIGMMYDEQVDSDSNCMFPNGGDDNQEERLIPRTILQHAKNRELLKFMLECALITTKHLDMDEDTRLKLAFEDDEEPDFKPMLFLTKFANAGVLKLDKVVNDEDDPTEQMGAIMTFLNNAYEEGVNIVDNSTDLTEEIGDK